MLFFCQFSQGTDVARNIINNALKSCQGPLLPFSVFSAPFLNVPPSLPLNHRSFFLWAHLPSSGSSNAYTWSPTPGPLQRQNPLLGMFLYIHNLFSGTSYMFNIYLFIICLHILIIIYKDMFIIYNYLLEAQDIYEGEKQTITESSE